MENKSKSAPKTNGRTYHLISNTMRQKLITLIQDQNMSIVHAASVMGINYENAKAIWRVYRKEGRDVKK